MTNAANMVGDAACRAEMTVLESAAAILLSHCTFQPGGWDKKFARDMRARAQSISGDPDRRITPKQRHWLWRLVWKYRRQIGTSGTARAITQRASVMIRQVASVLPSEEQTQMIVIDDGVERAIVEAVRDL